MKLRYLAYALLVVLQCLDLMTTAMALERGALERNSFLKHTETQGFTLDILVMKLIVPLPYCLFIEYCLRKVKGRREKMMYLVIFLGLLLFYVYVVANNVKVLLEVGIR